MTARPPEDGAREAAAAYGLEDARLELVPEGLINATYAALPREGGEPRAILQRLSPVFSPRVHEDIEAVTRHVAAKGVETPRLIPTSAGDLWVRVRGQVWRALTYIDGVTRRSVETPAQARSAGALVARFHAAAADLEHAFVGGRAGVHDTPAHLRGLREAAAGPPGGAAEEPSELAGARELAAEILDRASALPPLPDAPARPAHGDLKITNILFDRGDPERARCLIDLDTLTRQTLAYEVGDALRSWCNPAPEDAEDARVDLALLGAAIEGYAAEAGSIVEPAEIDALVPGLETICVELAARFCRDVFDDCYFGWDPSRYASRRAHNLARARGQLGLAGAVAAARSEAEEIVGRAFAGAR